MSNIYVNKITDVNVRDRNNIFRETVVSFYSSELDECTLVLTEEMLKKLSSKCETVIADRGLRNYNSKEELDNAE